MSKIFFLQLLCDFNSEKHYENVYSTKEMAIQQGISKLEKMFREEYEEMFEQNNKDNIPTITREQLFNLKVFYDFSITEYEPEFVDKLYDLKNLPIVDNYDISDSYCANLMPSKIIHSYDYNGNETYISGIYFFNYKGKRKESIITMHYEDYENPLAGTKFKKGDIVKIKNNKNSHFNYNFNNKLHVITDIPHKISNQKFFRNTYDVIVNHNSYDEGCHVDVFNENELELYTEDLPSDSPLIFFSKYVKGEIKLDNISWTDIKCGHITLNENKSFRDIPEIMKKLKGSKRNER